MATKVTTIGERYWTSGEDSWTRYEAATLTLRDGRLFMFDAALAGDADPAAIDARDGVAVLELGAGQWAVWLATDADENDFICFRKAGSRPSPSHSGVDPVATS